MMPYDYSNLVDKLITWSSLISAEFGGASFDGAGTTYELSGAHGRLVRVHLSGYVSLGFEPTQKVAKQKTHENSISALWFCKIKNVKDNSTFKNSVWRWCTWDTTLLKKRSCTPHLSNTSCEALKVLLALLPSSMQTHAGNCSGTCFWPGGSDIRIITISEWMLRASSLSSIRLCHQPQHESRVKFDHLDGAPPKMSEAKVWTTQQNTTKASKSMDQSNYF